MIGLYSNIKKDGLIKGKKMLLASSAVLSSSQIKVSEITIPE